VKGVLPLFRHLWQGRLIVAAFFFFIAHIQVDEQHPPKAEVAQILLWYANSDIPLASSRIL